MGGRGGGSKISLQWPPIPIIELPVTMWGKLIVLEPMLGAIVADAESNIGGN